MMSRVETKEMNGLNGPTGLEPAEGERKKQNAWAGPGPAAFDFRSELTCYSPFPPIPS
jgi:threonine aldolase